MPIHLSFFRSSRRLLVLLLIATLVLFGTFVVSARTWLAGSELKKAAGLSQPSHIANGILSQESGQSELQSQTPVERLEVELITVGPNGFEPAHINRPPGPFVLLIQNRSGTDLGPLRLDDEDSGRPAPVSRIAEARIDRQRLEYGERLDLSPGRYRLHQSESLGWSFQIAVLPR